MSIESSNAIDQLAAAVVERMGPRIPISVDLWSAKEVAAFAKVSESHVMQRWAPRKDFPKAIRPPVESGGHGRPRWKAVEVIEWMNKFQDKN